MNQKEKQTVQTELLQFICKNFMIDEQEEINLDESLADQGIIDSFGLIEIATYIENEYKLTIKEDDLTRNNFGSVNKITNYIHSNF